MLPGAAQVVKTATRRAPDLTKWKSRAVFHGSLRFVRLRRRSNLTKRQFCSKSDPSFRFVRF